MIVLVMGIAGSGKSTAAAAVAVALGVELLEGDDFHPPDNVRKMARGLPLTDEDRWPWLAALKQAMDAVQARGGSAAVSCSALKAAYRERLLAAGGVRLVYLKVSAAVAQARLAARRGHFFAAGLLQSQLDTLEEPQGALTVDADRDSGTVVSAILAGLRTGRS
jgi:gluconokinase